MIRNWSTKQFRAVSIIPAHIRWCLTGTPIQNSLDDLGALLKFLRVPIFKEIQIFRKHIILPTKSKGPGRFSHLRRLMESVCLRRTRAVLGLPEPSTETIALSLSPAEVDAYSSLLESCRRAIDMATSGRNTRKANQIMLEALLRARLLCNNGSRAYGNQHFPLGFPKNPEEAVSYLQTLDEAACSYCSYEVSSLNYSDDKGSGTLTVCHHLLCYSCVPRFKADLEDSCADGRANCPFCTHTDLITNFIVLSTAAPEYNAEKSKSYPTKLLKVVDVIKSQPHENKRFVDRSYNYSWQFSVLCVPHAW
jgi:SWI/SNF-related matrix-associated actin-dependent regulator of chromatin subfamily A3